MSGLYKQRLVFYVKVGVKYPFCTPDWPTAYCHHCKGPGSRLPVYPLQVHQSMGFTCDNVILGLISTNL
jgi:hypothetical protein